MEFELLAWIWKGGCIIRAVFLDRIKKTYKRNPNLASLIVDPEFAREMVQREAAWRRVVGLTISDGISTPGMCASLAYFDTYRKARLPASLVQAKRDLFGGHTYERVDRPGSYLWRWCSELRSLVSLFFLFLFFVWVFFGGREEEGGGG